MPRELIRILHIGVPGIELRIDAHLGTVRRRVGDPQEKVLLLPLAFEDAVEEFIAQGLRIFSVDLIACQVASPDIWMSLCRTDSRERLARILRRHSWLLISWDLDVLSSGRECLLPLHCIKLMSG